MPDKGQNARRSIFTRLVRGAIVFALVPLLVLFAITMWESWRATERSLSATVDTDIAGLVDIYASSEEEELRNRLEDRSTLVSLEGRQARYVLVRPDGTILGGNFKRWPTLGAGLSEQAFLTLSDGTAVFAHATRLSPDLCWSHELMSVTEIPSCGWRRCSLAWQRSSFWPYG